MDETSGTPATPPRHGLDGFFDQLRATGIRRRGDDKWVAGVCAAVATRLGVDALLVRAVFLLFAVFGGIGVLLYLLGWALLPNDDEEVLAEKGIHGDGRGILLLIAIALALFGSGEQRWLLWLVLVPVGFVLWWVIRSARAGRTSEQMGAEASAFANRLAARVGGAGRTSPPGGATETTSVPPTTTTPHGMGPGRTGVVEAPAPRVVRTRRRRAGLLGLLLTAGLGVAAYALGSMLAASNGWGGSPEVIGGAFALIGAGLALVVIGATGRRAGFASFLVTMLAIATVAGTTAPTVPSGGFGDRTWSVVSQPAGGFALTAGDATLSLVGAAPGSTVKVAIGAGELKVSVPRGTTATVDARVRVGQLKVRRAGDSTTVKAGVEATGDRTTVVGTGPTNVTLDVTLGAGEITITEETS